MQIKRLLPSGVAICWLVALRITIIAALVLVAACTPRSFDPEVEEALGTEHRLTMLSASIYQASLDGGIPEDEIMLEECLAKVVADKGFSQFSSPTKDQSWVALNPQQDLWRSPTNYPTEVMIFSPRLFKPHSGSPYYVGILFSGHRTNLAQLPAWKPLDIKTNLSLASPKPTR